MSALGIGNSFLEEPVSDGNAIPTYTKFVTFVNHIPILNDTAEHAGKTILALNWNMAFKISCRWVSLQIPNRCSQKALIEAYREKPL